MIAIGFGLAWVGYTLVFYGHSLVKGYNLSFLQVISPTSYYTGNWPPPLAGGLSIFPDGKPDDNATGTSATHSLSPQQQAGRQALKTRGRPPVQ